MPGFIATSVIDLFLFIRTIRIPISLEKSTQKTTLHRLQNLVRGESNLNKVTSSHPLHIVVSQMMVDQSRH